MRKAREATVGGSGSASSFNKSAGGGERERGSERGGGGRGGGFGGEGGRGGFLGKRRRDDGFSSSDDNDADIPEEVRNIPMPRDTPPPFPKEVLDKWYQARRDKRARFNNNNNNNNQQDNNHNQGGGGTAANSTPLGANDRSAGFAAKSGGDSTSAGAEKLQQERKKEEAKTVYESAPLIRDLRKEAVAFVPAVVRKKLDMAKGVGAIGGLMEPEEADRLERAGYMGGSRKNGGDGDDEEAVREEGEGRYKVGRGVMMEEVEDEDG